MTVLHVLTDSYHPATGGMEASLARIVALLERPPDRRIVVHVRDTRPPAEPGAGRPAGALRYLWAEKALLAAPTLASAQGYFGERHRMDQLLFRNAIQADIARDPGQRHAVISFFLSGAGFVAQHVASELGLPHLACAQGSDLTADMRTPSGFAAVDFVVRRADRLVAISGEQERWLRRLWPGITAISTIPNALPADFPQEIWRPRPGRPLRLVSDTGFHFKKGTHVLFHAFRQAVSAGLPLSLTVMGATEPAYRSYWETERARLGIEMGENVRFLEFVPQSRVLEELMGAHLYCSATLGEGCSNARLAALALGMPLLTTACGEMLDVGTGMDHVRLVAPGDAAAFAAALVEVARRMETSGVEIPESYVRELRERFAPARERSDWEAVLGLLLDPVHSD